MKDWIVITGPTASGKTRIAVETAARAGGEIVSVDSRQVYRGLDIGAGKDLQEYRISGGTIPHHMIDIVSPDEEYHVARYQKEALAVIEDIEVRGKVPVLCGGSGLYLEAILEDHQYIHIDVDPGLRQSLEQMPSDELRILYASGHPLNYAVDMENRKRLIRAIEIQHSNKSLPVMPVPDLPIFLIAPERTVRRNRISERLRARLNEGLIEEVQFLRKKYNDETLIRLGLEYKFVTLYLKDELTLKEMTYRLETAIHQFAKRQMTWFRRMERKGYHMVLVPEMADPAGFILEYTEDTN